MIRKAKLFAKFFEITPTNWFFIGVNQYYHILTFHIMKNNIRQFESLLSKIQHYRLVIVS
jgi:hypothetical protein